MHNYMQVPLGLNPDPNPNYIANTCSKLILLSI